MSQLVATQKSLPFRRQRFVARHRKRSILLRLARPFVKALLVVGSPTLAGYWVLTAPEFTLRSVRTNNLREVEPGWIQQRLSTHVGRPLVSMPMRSLEEQLEAHPWVASVRVNKRLPSQLQVDIQERRPVFVLRTDDGAFFVDAAGRTIAPWDGESAAWRDLPVVAGSGDHEVLAHAVAVVEELHQARPDWGAGVTRVEALNEWDFRVETSALPFALVVSAGSAAARVAELSTHLDRVRHALPEFGVADLRVPGSIVLAREE